MEIITIVQIVGGFVAGVCVTTVFNWLVQRAAYSRYMREKGARGNASQAQSSERLSLAIAEAMTLFQEGKKPMEILKELAPKYPDVALQLGGKFLKGKLGGLI